MLAGIAARNRTDSLRGNPARPDRSRGAPSVARKKGRWCSSSILATTRTSNARRVPRGGIKTTAELQRRLACDRCLGPHTGLDRAGARHGTERAPREREDRRATRARVERGNRQSSDQQRRDRMRGDGQPRSELKALSPCVRSLLDRAGAIDRGRSAADRCRPEVVPPDVARDAEQHERPPVWDGRMA